MKLIVHIILLVGLTSCSIFGKTLSEGDEKIIQRLISSIDLQMKYKKNYDRVFANAFYDMRGGDRDAKNDATVLNLSLDMSSNPAFMGFGGITVQYIKKANINYTIKVKTKIRDAKSAIVITNNITKDKNNIDKKFIMRSIHTDTIESMTYYAGSQADLFSEYSAELRAEESLARQAAREVYYDIVLSMRKHIQNCRKIGKILDDRKSFVFANDKSENENIDTLMLNDINVDNIKKHDYIVYQNACSFLD